VRDCAFLVLASRHNRSDAVSSLYFSHIYQPPPGATRRTLLLLHGPAGDEHQLLPVAQALQPTAAILSPRGQIDDEGTWRYFRRLSEGVFDLGDLQRRAEQLATFVTAASVRYRFDPREVVAVGLSDGATLASTLMLAWPGTLAGAVLFRSAVPAMPPRMPRLQGTPVLLANGRYDPVVQPEDTEDLAALLRVAGADVSVALQPAAQQIVHADIEEARAWLTSCGTMRSPMRTS
jgi:phospholipase/carboxylesterase